MPSIPLDTRYQIETPEGIDLPLRPAGLVPRALAFAFDLVARAVIMGVLLVPLALLGDIGYRPGLAAAVPGQLVVHGAVRGARSGLLTG